ncbi:uncharacterized protein EV154DRAFT_516835 [Mucor mucedo]|uniref:uncharacterized protein n=1 Tax=Mucor mucedo TaxID=29922 RepID=UPI00221E633D|nr:uncharacterized protein EV154DRAFT_516835 [Mucor mucedo]KAI7888783.1 hypothetical protein EV154DRAFT_516835 [Mucor mucedo]
MAGKGVVRSIKNYAKGFSEVQIKVREATSNDTWGPSGSLMNEIAQLTFNEHDFIEIMDMLDRRLNDKGKNWRHVFKALLVLDYCLHVGSENVVLYAKENIYVVRTLKEFQHVDDTGKDVGFNVRQKAKDITSLLLDEQRLKEERRSRQQMQDRMANVGDYMNDMMLVGKSNTRNEDHAVYDHPGYLDEDKDLKKAIEESKRMAEQEFRNRGVGTDADLQKALEESEREARENERKKREALERQNQDNLFGNQQTFQPFPASQSFDSSLNPYGQQQQQYSQQQQQYIPQQQPIGQQQQQPIYGQQHAQQQWPQSTGLTGMSFTEPIQQQQTFSNPYQQQSVGFNNLGLQAQMTGMPLQTQMTGMPLQAQMTGMPQQQQFQTQQFNGAQNNPFGQSNTPTQQQNGIFGTPTSVNPQVTGMQTTNQSDTSFSKLNSLLANRDDGMDTFGNTGNLRIPYGTGFASTLVPQSSNKAITDSPSFSQPFGQQPNRNPFGQSPSTPTGTPQQSQKSLLEMMQEQRLQPQMTGYNQPQMTGMQQGYTTNQSQQSQHQQQQQQQPSFF